MEFPAFAKSLESVCVSKCRYSICTLVSKPSEYSEMLESFVNAGFKPGLCEYLYCDNSKTNRLDAYAAYNAFLNSAQGDYIILCHQDILLNYDKLEKLEQCILELDSIDPNWALLGNAGGVKLAQSALRISHPGAQQNTGRFPIRVQSLDENFILVKRSANLCLSHDLKGFHLYGTDICLIAKILGLTAWVVDFHLYHKSEGRLDSHFFDSCYAMMLKYRSALHGDYIQTTCALLSTKRSNWSVNHAIFTQLYRLNKQRKKSSEFKEQYDCLIDKIGRTNYAIHWILYKLTKPGYNLVRSINKRLDRL